MKKVLITGGTSGLGLEIAKKFLEKKFAVTILGKDNKNLAKVKKTIENTNLSTIQCDLRNYRDIQKSLSCVNEIDVLINNAGIITYKKFDEYNPQA